MHHTVDMSRSGGFVFSAWSPTGETLRKLGRGVIVAGALGLLAYSAVTAWHVLGELRTVRLSDCARALDSVSVGDAVLCIIGYKLGGELLRAIARASRAQ